MQANKNEVHKNHFLCTSNYFILTFYYVFVPPHGGIITLLSYCLEEADNTRSLLWHLYLVGFL